MSVVVSVLVLTAFVLVFGAGLLTLAGFLGPKPKYSNVKESPYECGLPGQESGSTVISVRFYLTAILFILFDIEIIFMYPWAISFTDFIAKGQGLYALSAMGVFLFIFIYGLIWEIKSKALEWE